MHPMHPKRLAAACLAACLAFVAGLPALAAHPPGVTKAASVEGITEYRQANGHKVLLIPDLDR
ncbi:MAG: hypothetical protein AB7I13_20785, partial [Vicinamibacterales bacterium]